MIQFPVTVTRTVVFGAACWALSVVFFLDQAIVQLAFARPYSLQTNLISDLGNTACGPDICSPLHTFMNATFIAVGLLHWAGAVATWRAWPSGGPSVAGKVVLAFAGWCLAYAGANPENLRPALHTFGAVGGLISLNLAMILLGMAVVGAARWLGGMALVAGIVGLVGFGLLLSGGVGLPIGVTERIADYPGAAMIVVLGIFLLGWAVQSRTRLKT
ncbi:MAG TPA: DUF998 domain-containing protein [Candidatus Dormibacteraeota bacterium]|nr:DUF998 domain-containing protein [Candidatus Dormibacteraeota bacterium]